MFSRNAVFAVALLSALSLAACNSDVPASNPFDRSSLAPAKGRVTGTLAGENGKALASPVVTLVSAHGGAATNATVAGNGAFSVEVNPGDYVLKAEAQGFDSLQFPGVHVAPGDSHDAGTLTLSIVRVKVTGSVSLEGGGDPSGAVVQLISTETPTLRQVTVAGSDGHYEIVGAAPGSYVVRASKTSFAPAYGDTTEVVPQKEVSAGELHLRPASAVVRFEVGGTIGAKYTNDPEVKLLLLAFGDAISDMQVSEDPAFADAAQGDTGWKAFAPESAWSLHGDDGAHTVYARFRDKFGIVSEAFTAAVVLDRAAPEAGQAQLGDGSGFARSGAPLALHLEAQDALSGITGYAVAADGTVDTEAFVSVDGPLGTPVTLDTTVALGTARGSRTVAVVVRDGAGNLSIPLTIPAFVDTSAPVAGSPAVLVENGATVTHSASVQVALQVTGDAPDEALFFALATSPGIPDTGTYLPLGTGPVPFELASGPDGQRQVCARFSDEAGNRSEESCATITLDTTGQVSGQVSLEGAPSTLAGVTATLTSDADPTFSRVATTDATGAFALANVPQGVGYVLSLSESGYRTQVVRGVAVFSGRVTTPELPMLSLARGSLTGTVTLNDHASGEYGGIVVFTNGQPFAATTAPDGTFLLRDLPVGAYEIAARLSGYLPVSFGTVTVQADRTQELGTQQLKRQSGTFYVCRQSDPGCTKGPLDFVGTRSVSLYLTSSTATQYRAGFTQDLSSATYLPLVSGQTSYAFTLQDQDGLQNVWVQYRDGQGNEQAPLTAAVTLDRQAPTGATVLINADAQGQTAASTNDLAGHVTLTLAATDALSGLGTVVVSNEDSVFNEAPQLFRSPLDWTINTASDGKKTVYVQFCDRVGNCTAAATSPRQQIVLDRVAPSAAQGYAVKLSGGATVTGSAQITVDVTIGADAQAVRFGTSATLAGTTWIALDPTQGTSASFPFLLPAGDGPKTVYVQFADQAGNLSTVSPPAFQSSIVLDTQAPQGPRIVVPGNGYTNQSTLTLGLAATGSPAEMQVVVADFEDFSNVSWEAYAATKQVSLTSDKTWRFFARFRDAAGNASSTATAQVVRDTVAPSNGAVSVVEGAYAKSQQVNLRLFATDADEMQVSSDGAYDTEPWQAYNTAVAFSLVPVQATPYTVKARFRDRAGNVSPDATATVSVDTQVPTVSLTLNGAASGNRTNRLTVVAGGSANDNIGIAQYELSNASDFAGAIRSTYSSSVSWQLDPTGGDGLKTVYARVTDQAGNTATASATITYDTTPPSGTVAIADGALVKAPAITLNLTRDTEVTQVAFGEGALDCASATYQAWPVSNTKAFTLSSGDGQKTVVACFRDQAGNASSANATTTLDTAAPTPSGTPVITVNGYTGTGTNYASSAILRLHFNVAGADKMRLSCDDVLDTETVQPFLADTGCVLTAGQGVRKVQAEFLDNAGNRYAAPAANVTLDTVDPAVPTGLTMTSAGGTAITGPTNQAAVILGWTKNTDDTAQYRLQLGTTSALVAPALDVTQTANSYAYTPAEGKFYWRVAAIDAAGNQSAWSTVQTLVVDRTPPSDVTLSFTTPSETQIVVTWNAPGDDKDANNLDAGSYYDLRYVQGNSLDLNTAPAAPGMPTPAGIRISQSYTFNSLTRKKLYLMAMRTCDDAGNCSGWSPTLSVNMPDQTPPAAISDLTATLAQGKVTVRWTNPGDDGTGGGNVTYQTIYVREGPLVTAADFAAAIQIPLTNPGAAGTQTSIDVPSAQTGAYFTALKVNTAYTVAVKSADYFQNWSAASNVVTRLSTAVTGVRPAAAAPGDWVELDGLNFGATQATVNFNGVAASEIALWTPNLVRVRVPDGAGSGPVSIFRGVVDSDAATFTVAPSIASVYPREVLIGQTLYVGGTNFGQSTDANTALLAGGQAKAANTIADWSQAGLSTVVPATQQIGINPVRVQHGSAVSRAAPVRVWSSADLLTDGTKFAIIDALGTSPVNGDSHVLEHYLSGSVYKFGYRRYVASTGLWDAEVDPAAAVGAYGNFMSADVDVDANGTAHMCLMLQTTVSTTTTQYVYYRQRTAAGTWLAPVLVYSLPTTTASISDCHIAAPTNGSTSYPTLVWVVGLTSNFTSHLYGSQSSNSGASFTGAAQFCPNGAGGCTSPNFEASPDITGVDGFYGPSVHLIWVQRNSGSAIVKGSWSGIGAGALLNFASTPVTLSSSTSCANCETNIETIRGVTGFNPAVGSIAVWTEPSAFATYQAKAAFSAQTNSAGWSPANAILVDSSVDTNAHLGVAVTRDGDASILVPAAEQVVVNGSNENVVRHHVVRWNEMQAPYVDAGGDEIGGMTLQRGVWAAGGANGLVTAVWDSKVANTYTSLKASRTVLPHRDPAVKTVYTPAAGRAVGSMQSTVVTESAAANSIHTAFIEEDDSSTVTTQKLLWVRESEAGVVSGPVTLSSATLAAGANSPCKQDHRCKERFAIAPMPANTAAVAYYVPQPTGTSETLLLCPNAASCGTPLVVASGQLGRVSMVGDGSGTLHITYDVHPSTSTGSVYYRRYQAGALTNPVLVSGQSATMPEPGDSREPTLVLPPTGTPHIVYRRVYGANTLRVRSILPGDAVSPATDLVTSASAIDHPTAAWTPDGIALAWREGGDNRAVSYGLWLYGWVEAPVLSSAIGDSWTMLADPLGQRFLHVDTQGDQVFDRFLTLDDLSRTWRGPISWGSKSDYTRQVTEMSVDPRGRYHLHSTIDGFFGAPALYRLRYVANSW